MKTLLLAALTAPQTTSELGAYALAVLGLAAWVVIIIKICKGDL